MKEERPPKGPLNSFSTHPKERTADDSTWRSYPQEALADLGIVDDGGQVGT
jgi:hypothetical protein